MLTIYRNWGFLNTAISSLVCIVRQLFDTKLIHGLENEIVGEALIALRHEELKEMSILSVGHRLTILKGVYDIKVKQEIPIESDHYIPPSQYFAYTTMSLTN